MISRQELRVEFSDLLQRAGVAPEHVLQLLLDLEGRLDQLDRPRLALPPPAKPDPIVEDSKGRALHGQGKSEHWPPPAEREAPPAIADAIEDLPDMAPTAGRRPANPVREAPAAKRGPKSCALIGRPSHGYGAAPKKAGGPKISADPPARDRTPWTTEDDQQLALLVGVEGRPGSEVAELMQRSIGSVAMRQHFLNIHRPDLRDKAGRRRCLKCQVWFQSAGAHDRLCSVCKGFANRRGQGLAT